MKSKEYIKGTIKTIVLKLLSEKVFQDSWNTIIYFSAAKKPEFLKHTFGENPRKVSISFTSPKSALSKALILKAYFIWLDSCPFYEC